MTLIERKIGDDCIVGDGAHAKIQRQQTGIIYITSKNIKNERLDSSNIDYISEEDFNKYFKANSKAIKKPQKGDVLLCIIGASMGDSCFVTIEDYVGLSSSVAILRANQSILCPKYLYYWTRGYIFQDGLRRIRSGSAQGFLSLEMVRSLPLYYPNLITQQRIAEILSNYDRLIDNNNRRIALLEESIHLLYKEWFVRSRFPGYESVKFVDGVPEGWERVDFGEALILQRGFDLPNKDRKSGDIPIYASTGINGFHDTAKVKAPGIVTGRSGTLGTVMYIHKDFWPLNTTLWVKEFIKVSPPFAYCLLSQMDLNSYQAGAAVPTLNRNVIHGVKIIIPGEQLQKNFDNFINPILIQIECLKKYNNSLKEARDLLLPRLMNGSIAV